MGQRCKKRNRKATLLSMDWQQSWKPWPMLACEIKKEEILWPTRPSYLPSRK